ncbi:hypothetical protein [uncultured Rikenella sp.]|uniref:Cbp1 family collagen-binding glycoprotein adhesin n=1 Tax=uncultured Rikenella sp. TaxID=368003 RepID=UPI002632723F|nr:hypothetical protein [uncultured Rikenella sp.]
MKKILILAFGAAALASCGPKADKPDPTALANDSLTRVIAAKDSIINDAFNSIGEIAANINRIAEREKVVVRQTSAGGELTKPVREQIAENITAISDLLDKNRATIARLQVSANKLKEANVRIEGFQTLIAQLQEQLDQKNVQLAALTDQVKALKVEVEALGHTVTDLENDKAELQGTVASQDAALHTVYYIVASDKELVEKDIVDKKGFIGRTRVVSDNASMADFTRADDRTVERIPVGKARVRIVTSHPENSYMLVKGAKEVVEELVITDKDAFWKNSKMLVISHK